MKKSFACFLVIIGLLVCTMNICASTVFDSKDSSRWDNITCIILSLDFDHGIGEAVADVLGDTDVDSITSRMQIYKQTSTGMWVFEGQTYGSVIDNTMHLSKTFSAYSGAYYKVELHTNVVKNGVPEAVTKTVYGTCP